MPSSELRPTTAGGTLRLDDDVCVFDRNGVYQARIRLNDGRYIWRSLKTSDQQHAISAARRLQHSIAFRRENGLSLDRRKHPAKTADVLTAQEAASGGGLQVSRRPVPGQQIG